jgi:hypothetical protein
MAKFPKETPKRRVVKALLTIPNHRRIKGATLRAICTQAGIPRSKFLQAFEGA